MHALANIALRAANDAGEALAHSGERLDKVAILNADPDNFITSLDENADKTIIYHLEKAFPTHSINSRFSGLKEGEDKNTVWLVDPLIGGQNLSRGYPSYGVSIACEIGGVVNHSVIVVPALREEIVASRGKGVQLNSRRIRVNTDPAQGASLYGINCQADNTQCLFSLQRELMSQGGAVRSCGVTALDLVDTAIGRLDGGWSENQNPLSLVAALLILQEAGGLIGSESGNPSLTHAKELLFAGPSVFKQLLKIRKNLS